jgi:hypothetical protein
MPFKIVQKQPPKESTVGLDTAYRIPAIAATGVAATLPGVFGDVAKTANDLIAAPITKYVFGQEPVPYEQSTIGKFLPTTQQHQKNIEKAIPSLKPKNKLEEFSQNIAKDTASLFLPGQMFRMGRYAMTPMRSLGTATAANVAGTGTELWTGDKSKGDMVRSGSMLALSLMNPTSARDISQNLYRSAGALLPQNATVNAGRFTNRLNNLETRILRGRPIDSLALSERFVINQIENFRNLIQNGQINMQSLVAQRRSFNEELQRGLFELPDRATRARARELAQEISHATRDTMRQYGVQNPRWLHYQQAADQAHGAIAQSNFISNVLQRFMRGRPEGLAHLFGIGVPIGGALFSPVGAGTGVAAYQAAKIGTRVVRSPELRNHYARVIGAAAADNPKLIRKELDELEEKIEKQQEKSKNKYRIIKRQ